VGSSQKVIDRTIEKLNNDFPAINIVGYRNGYLKDGEKEQLKSDIVEKKPDIVFVAQGTPAQEYLMNDLMDVHKALYMGLGGSFDVYTGCKKRAPKFYLDFHLEWFYRLLKEPTRLSRQIVLIRFLILLKLRKL
jgi:UDP-N-acetyl-D-mannosaminouronate:lipid I N-acetyl-D-mannosaminouronosyltransferase